MAERGCRGKEWAPAEHGEWRRERVWGKEWAATAAAAEEGGG